MSITKYDELMGLLDSWQADPHDECMTEHSWYRMPVSEGGHGIIALPVSVDPANDNGFALLRKGAGQGAHRIALDAVNPWHPPLGPNACHGPCNDPTCVNPSHLSWQTQAGNVYDKVRDGTTHKPTGLKHHRTKFESEDQVLDIYNRAHAGTETLVDIGKDYGVTKCVVWDIKHGRKWSHLTGHPKKERTS